VTKFRVVPTSSTVAAEMRSSVHTIRAGTRELTGVIEGELDDNGLPRLEAPHGANLQVAVETMKSGHRFQDLEMQRRIEARRFPSIDVAVSHARRLEPDGACRASVTVTAHGRTSSFEEDFTMRVEGHRLVIEGEHTFDMRDFEVNPPSLLTLKVRPEVRVAVRIVADREAVSSG
jgi:YceI-like domain